MGFGNALNVARTMESNGVAGLLHINTVVLRKKTVVFKGWLRLMCKLEALVGTGDSKVVHLAHQEDRRTINGSQIDRTVMDCMTEPKLWRTSTATTAAAAAATTTIPGRMRMVTSSSAPSSVAVSLAT